MFNDVYILDHHQGWDPAGTTTARCGLRTDDDGLYAGLLNEW